jgi:hypothetical protein
MDHAVLYARIRELVATGELPFGPEMVAQVSIGSSSEAVCLVCEASGALQRVRAELAKREIKWRRRGR